MKANRGIVGALACTVALGAPDLIAGEARVVQFRLEDARGGRTLTLDAAEGLGRAEAWAEAYRIVLGRPGVASMRRKLGAARVRYAEPVFMAATEFGQVLERNKAAQREWDDAFSFAKDSPGQKRHLQNLIETVYEDAGTSEPLREWLRTGLGQLRQKGRDVL